jgi:arsenate reductase
VLLKTMTETTIYHNPACSTSRNTLALLRDAGIEPTVVEYLKTPPTKERLRELAAAIGVPVRGLVRAKETLFAELHLDHPARSEDELLEAMVAHPVLINRPIVVTPLGARLCRPVETVREILP